MADVVCNIEQTHLSVICAEWVEEISQALSGYGRMVVMRDNVRPEPFHFEVGVPILMENDAWQAWFFPLRTLLIFLRTAWLVSCMASLARS